MNNQPPNEKNTFSLHNCQSYYFWFSFFLTSSRREYFWFFPDIHTGLFLIKNPKKFLAINNFFVNETKYRHPNKRLFH